MNILKPAKGVLVFFPLIKCFLEYMMGIYAFASQLLNAVL